LFTTLRSESFSPDGAQILGVGNCGGSAAGSYLVTVNVDGGGVTRIPNTRGAHLASPGEAALGAFGCRSSTLF
jgi:hypothetical protein